MKKIKNKEEIERRNRINKFILGVLMISLMLASSLGYAFFSSDGITEENIPEEINGEFINGRWVYQFGDQQFAFLSFIGLAEKVSVDMEKTLVDYYSKQIYIDSERETFEEISLNLGSYTSRINEACYGPCEENLPEKQCDSLLIVHRSSSENRVYQQDNCIFIEGDIVAVDAFLYRILGFTQETDI